MGMRTVCWLVTAATTAAIVACSPQEIAAGAFEMGAAQGDQLLLDPVPLSAKYGLPVLPEATTDAAGRIGRDTQVYRRAELLDVDATTPYDTWATAAETVATDRDILPALLNQALPEREFTGTTLSELTRFVAAEAPAHITVANHTLIADTALTIESQDVVIDFAGASIDPGKRPPLWLIELRGAHDAAVTNAVISGGLNGILVDGGSRITVSDNDIDDLDQNGIVVTGDASLLSVDTNELGDLGRAGIMLHGTVSSVLVEKNTVSDLQGHSNWNAGILLTGRRGDIAADPDAFFLPDGHWVVEEPIHERLENPERNIILDNTIQDGHSSGIYNDGAVANLFLRNRIDGNAKEGVCFDNGATANVFAGNVVTDNGRRWGQPDDVLAFESVLDEGRTVDGSAAAKLPGVSIDNAIYNQIYANEISDNWGGGIKMVRTSLFNLIGRNMMADNNLGRSAQMHFFGIELGAARADFPATDLDFVGSSGNILFHNMIQGDHYSGIFIARGSLQNELIDNDIDGFEAFDVERPH